MHKSTKVILILSGCFMIAGAILLGIGIILGAPKSLHFTKGHFVDASKASVSYTKEKTKIDSFNNIDIDCSVCELNFEKSDDYYLSYDFSGINVEDPTYSVKDNTLSFKSHDSGNYDISFDLNLFSHGSVGSKRSVTIYYPENASLDHVKVKTSAGDFDIKDLTCKSADFSAKLGDIQVNDCTFDTLNLDASSGSVELKNITCNTSCESDIALGSFELSNCTFNKFTSTLKTGSLEGKNCDFKDATAKAKMGSIDLDLTGKESEYAFGIDVGAGDFEINGSHHINNNSSATKHINLDCSMGSIEIETK